MRDDLIVSESIEINTEPDKVWEALTNPEIIKEYLFGTQTITDWKVGSDIIFQGEYQGKIYRDKGVIKEYIPNKLISYSYWSGFSGLEDKPENYSLVNYNVEAIGDKKTKFTWTQKGFADEKGYEHSKKGMKEFLEKIKNIIER
jgi:uncharacterized protein YndB with AHSA1/START domain